jgi:hypothetical protein
MILSFRIVQGVKLADTFGFALYLNSSTQPAKKLSLIRVLNLGFLLIVSIQTIY